MRSFGEKLNYVDIKRSRSVRSKMMDSETRGNELVTLKIIAETLNRSNDLKHMLQSVLEKLLKVTGLTTGWIFLADERPIYTFIADYNLPPALSREEKKPMCEGTCWCLNRFWDGKLQQAVNIINCKRIEDATEYSLGDTKGITHHATVPLSAGGEMFGVLNVASPGKEHFSDEELTLLQSVAFQIGTALKRTRLYQAQRKRAEQLAKLDETSRFIWKISELSVLPEAAVEKIGSIFNWASVSFYRNSGTQLKLRSVYTKGKEISIPNQFSIEVIETIIASMKEHEKMKPELCNHAPNEQREMLIMPLEIRDELFGALVINGESTDKFDEADVEVLKALADHLSLVIENIRLNEKRRELTVLEERNRLARDLHDSVNQKLFSLSLTARGVKEIMPKDNDLLTESMQDIQTLSQEALAEMRSLIWQLRPPGLEEGVITALRNYGKSLGLKIIDSVKGAKELPQAIEEALWRIGQEALNNVKKHALAKEAAIFMEVKSSQVILTVYDNGCGFEIDPENNGKWSIGLSSMKERAELIGGQFAIESSLGKGTKISIALPL
jgi:two-component system, NarL family, sensor kinase